MTMADNRIGNIDKMGGGGDAQTSPMSGLASYLKNCWVRWAFVLSCTALAVLVPHGHGTIPTLAIGFIAAFLTAALLTFRFALLEKIFETVVRWQILLAAVFAFVAAFNFYGNFCWTFHMGIELGVLPDKLEAFSGPVYVLAGLAAIIAAPAAFVFLYAFISRFVPIVKEGIQKSDTVEKCFFIVGGLILSATLLVLYHTTTAFYGMPANLIYGSDTHLLVEQNFWMNINAGQNDLRRPLFGLYAMPFALVATLLSYVLFFIPNLYLISLGIIQVVLALVCAILLGRMLHLETCSKIFFLTAFLLSYPLLVFFILLEKYIFSTFWLILFLHTVMFRRHHRDAFFIGATGSMLTSGFFFFLLSEATNWKNWLMDMIMSGLKLLVVITLFGQLAVVLTAVDRFHYLQQWGGGTLTLYEKFLVFINFIQGCFMTLPSEIDFQHHFPVYELTTVQSLNLIALLFLLWVITGFFLNAKDRFAQICFSWVVASFLILCIGGWGTAENSMMLYTVYFGWAYFCLAFLAIEKSLQKLPTVKCVVYTMCIAVLAYINIPGFYDLIQFGIKYYPHP